jgi:hypothetical protein
MKKYYEEIMYDENNRSQIHWFYMNTHMDILFCLMFHNSNIILLRDNYQSQHNKD